LQTKKAFFEEKNSLKSLKFANFAILLSARQNAEKIVAMCSLHKIEKLFAHKVVFALQNSKNTLKESIYLI